jgi:hypothetical protein
MTEQLEITDTPKDEDVLLQGQKEKSPDSSDDCGNLQVCLAGVCIICIAAMFILFIFILPEACRKQCLATETLCNISTEVVPLYINAKGDPIKMLWVKVARKRSQRKPYQHVILSRNKI